MYNPFRSAILGQNHLTNQTWFMYNCLLNIPQMSWECKLNSFHPLTWYFKHNSCYYIMVLRWLRMVLGEHRRNKASLRSRPASRTVGSVPAHLFTRHILARRPTHDQLRAYHPLWHSTRCSALKVRPVDDTVAVPSGTLRCINRPPSRAVQATADYQCWSVNHENAVSLWPHQNAHK